MLLATFQQVFSPKREFWVYQSTSVTFLKDYLTLHLWQHWTGGFSCAYCFTSNITVIHKEKWSFFIHHCRIININNLYYIWSYLWITMLTKRPVSQKKTSVCSLSVCLSVCLSVWSWSVGLKVWFALQSVLPFWFLCISLLWNIPLCLQKRTKQQPVWLTPGNSGIMWSTCLNTWKMENGSFQMQFCR